MSRLLIRNLHCSRGGFVNSLGWIVRDEVRDRANSCLCCRGRLESKTIENH